MFKVKKEHNDLECPIGHSFLYGEIKKMLSRDEFIAKYINELAFSFFNSNYTDREEFINDQYNAYIRTEKVNNIKQGDLLSDVLPEIVSIRAKDVISYTRDYLTVRCNIHAKRATKDHTLEEQILEGSLRIATEDLLKYIHS